MIVSILERKDHLHKTQRILGNNEWQWRWQRQWSYVSATWPTRCLARTFLIAASSLSNKSKVPWSEYINSSVYQFHHVFPINNLMFLRLTQFGCNCGWHDLTVYITKNIKNLGQKIQTLGKASNASLVGAKTVSGLWPARRLVSVANATPRAFTWNIFWLWTERRFRRVRVREKGTL